MELKANKFTRGQVWYWSDPIYLNKANASTVAYGEGNIRYSRYVLIIQNSDTVSGSTVVLPLSSSGFRKTDIAVQLLDSMSKSYIRINKLMTVNTSQLTKYICTLTDATMSCIDMAVAYYILPNVYNLYKTDSDLASNEVSTMFQDLVKDDMSINNRLHLQQKISNINSESEKECRNTETCDETTHKRKRVSWDDNMKLSFLEYAKEHTISETAEKFSITPASAYKYRIQFRRDLGIAN